MNNDQNSQPSGNIDGFIPRTPQSRHVGFDGGSRRSEALPGVRTRRPGFRGHHGHPIAPDKVTPSSSLPGFTPRRTVNQVGIDSLDLPKPQPLDDSDAGLADKHAKRDKKHRSHGKHIHWKKIILRTGLAIAVLFILCGGWLGWKVLRNTSKVFGGSSNLLGFLSATPLQCESAGRCNVLVAGYSVDDPQNTGGALTDSIMVASIDLRHNTALLLSIPRDLYVSIPGYSYAKINETYEDGQHEHFSQAGYASGGMGLLEKVASQTFGMPIHYYVLIDNNALKDAVNAVGGITVNIQSPDPRGIYDAYTHLKLPNGMNYLNGQQALNLARARGDITAGDVSYGLPGSDFDRTQHQREMLVGLKDKATSGSVLANPLKLGQVFDAIGNNVHTDLSTGNFRRLYDITKNINSANIKSYGLNNVTYGGQSNVDLLQNYNTPSGQEALIPSVGLGNYTQFQLFWQQITSNNPVLKEAANVVVLNGGNIAGLAATEAKSLTAKGINVSITGNAPTGQAVTTIVDNSHGKAPATLAELKSLFGSNVGTNATLSATYPNADFIVVLGADRHAP